MTIRMTIHHHLLLFFFLLLLLLQLLTNPLTTRHFKRQACRSSKFMHSGVRVLNHDGIQLTYFCLSHIQFDARSHICSHILLSFSCCFLFPESLESCSLPTLTARRSLCMQSLQVYTMLSSVFLTTCPQQDRVDLWFVVEIRERCEYKGFHMNVSLKAISRRWGYCVSLGVSSDCWLFYVP